MITDKSKSGTQPNDHRSGDENASGHDGNETLEPKQSSANSSGSNDGCKNEVTDNINESSETGESENTLSMIINDRDLA